MMWKLARTSWFSAILLEPSVFNSLSMSDSEEHVTRIRTHSNDFTTTSIKIHNTNDDGVMNPHPQDAEEMLSSPSHLLEIPGFYVWTSRKFGILDQYECLRSRSFRFRNSQIDRLHSLGMHSMDSRHDVGGSSNFRSPYHRTWSSSDSQNLPTGASTMLRLHYGTTIDEHVGSVIQIFDFILAATKHGPDSLLPSARLFLRQLEFYPLVLNKWLRETGFRADLGRIVYSKISLALYMSALLAIFHILTQFD